MNGDYSIGLEKIPYDCLEADSQKRYKWINIDADSMPEEIFLPLYQKLTAEPITDSKLEYTQILVAVYKRVCKRGKYDEYEYRGDMLK